MTFSHPDSSGSPVPDHRQHPGSDEGLSSPKQGVGSDHDSEIRSTDHSFHIRGNPNLPGKSAIPPGAASSSGRGQNRSRRNRSIPRPNSKVRLGIPRKTNELNEFEKEHDQAGLEVLRIHSEWKKSGMATGDIEVFDVLVPSGCSLAKIESDIKSVSSVAQRFPNCRISVIDQEIISQTHQRLMVIISRKRLKPEKFLYRDIDDLLNDHKELTKDREQTLQGLHSSRARDLETWTRANLKSLVNSQAQNWLKLAEWYPGQKGPSRKSIMGWSDPMVRGLMGITDTQQWWRRHCIAATDNGRQIPEMICLDITRLAIDRIAFVIDSLFEELIRIRLHIKFESPKVAERKFTEVVEMYRYLRSTINVPGEVRARSQFTRKYAEEKNIPVAMVRELWDLVLPRKIIFSVFDRGTPFTESEVDPSSIISLRISRYP